MTLTDLAMTDLLTAWWMTAGWAGPMVLLRLAPVSLPDSVTESVTDCAMWLLAWRVDLLPADLPADDWLLLIDFLQGDWLVDDLLLVDLLLTDWSSNWLVDWLLLGTWMDDRLPDCLLTDDWSMNWLVDWLLDGLTDLAVIVDLCLKNFLDDLLLHWTNKNK